MHKLLTSVSIAATVASKLVSAYGDVEFLCYRLIFARDRTDLNYFISILTLSLFLVSWCIRDSQSQLLLHTSPCCGKFRRHSQLHITLTSCP